MTTGESILLQDHSLRRPGKWMLPVILLLIGTGGFFLIYSGRQDPMKTYERHMAVFRRQEDSALALYKLPREAGNDQRLTAIRYGLSGWSACDSVLKVIGHLKIASELLEKNNKLQTYVGLRLKAYRVVEADLAAGTEVNKAEYQSLMQQIDELINDLNNIKD